MLMTPSRSTSAEAQWEPVLRAYAALLDEHRVLLLTVGVEGVVDESVMVVPPFEPPSGMLPLPAAFAGWVAALERARRGGRAAAPAALHRADRPRRRQRPTGG